MKYESFLGYRKLRFFRLTAAAVIPVMVLAALLPERIGFGYGGSWLGYVLGCSSALVVCVLGWYGIRKRRPMRVADRRQADRRRRVVDTAAGDGGGERRSRERRQSAQGGMGAARHGGTLLGWLSAHVYLGGAVLVFAILHSGLNFGMNVATLALLLLLLIAASGVWGALAYLRYPPLLARSGEDENLAGSLDRLAETERALGECAARLPPEASGAIALAAGDDPLAIGMLEKLGLGRAEFATEVALARIRSLAEQVADPKVSAGLREAYALLLRKGRVLNRIHDESTFRFRMRVWQVLHGPLSLALVACIVVHVLTVFVFW